jgi:SpoVK/Ycf46/Vps4 family AAA+-type ATPase
LAEEGLSGGFSGAELISVCRDAALLALEDDDSAAGGGNPSIRMHHLLKSIKGMQRQITPEMIQFYDSFRKSQDQT